MHLVTSGIGLAKTQAALRGTHGVNVGMNPGMKLWVQGSLDHKDTQYKDTHRKMRCGR